MKLRLVAVLAVMALLLWCVPVRADELYTYSGTTVNGPQFNRPGAAAPFPPTGFVVSYSAQGFEVNQATTCFVSSVQARQFDGFIHVYQASFSPLNSGSNVIMANDDGPLGPGSSQTPTFTVLANTPYFVVTSAFQTGTDGDFQNTVACESAALPQPLVITHGSCTLVQDNTRTCLNGDRFQVSATVTQPGGQPRPAQLVQSGAGDSALFWFLNAQNWELLVKVINFCGQPENAYRVFAAGTTTFAVTVTVVDQQRGGVATVTNPLNTSFQNQVVPIPNSCP